MNTLFEAVKAALVANYGWVVDDARAAKVAAIDQSPLKLLRIAKAGDCAVALQVGQVIHSLRKLYVDDQGTVHLSTEQVNGNLAIGYLTNIEVDVDNYNRMIDDGHFDCVKLTDVTRIVTVADSQLV